MTKTAAGLVAFFKSKQQLQKEQEYRDYIETHRANVMKAWKVMQQKCKNEVIIYDDWRFWGLYAMVKEHDESKLSPEEFHAYRRCFYPCWWENPKSKRAQKAFQKAVEHHYANNSHHWEYWTGKVDRSLVGVYQSLSYAEMVLDWTAMGYVFGDTAKDYYEKNKDRIVIASDCVEFVERLLDQMAAGDGVVSSTKG